ncbi:MAG: AraC family transcriptional regulator [Gemmatimonadetes bacterium]|nr:AraC family transcriptional regulator [Gemmatimonadota bacterium]
MLRERIRRIAPARYEVGCLRSWDELRTRIRGAQAHALFLVDPYHGRGRLPGSAPELIQLLRDFPSTTVVVAMAPRPGWLQDVLTLGERGVTEVIDLGSELSTEAVRQRLDRARGRPLRTLLQRGVEVSVPGRGRAILDTAVEVASCGGGVHTLARALGLSGPTLLRWCARSGLPNPRRLMIWLRVLSAAELLDDPGRSVLDIAFSCGYSSDRALRRALLCTVGIGPAELRRRGAFRTAAGRFLAMLRQVRRRSPAPALARVG